MDPRVDPSVPGNTGSVGLGILSSDSRQEQREGHGRFVCPGHCLAHSSGPLSGAGAEMRAEAESSLVGLSVCQHISTRSVYSEALRLRIDVT